jgi:hypothetical protein
MTSLGARGALVLLTTAALASPVASVVASAQPAGPLAASARPAAPATTATTTVATADELVRKLVRTTNQGKKKAARTVASTKVVSTMFGARQHGFRFAKPLDDCLYDADHQRYDCSTALLKNGEVYGSAYFVVPSETDAPMVTKVSIAYGE